MGILKLEENFSKDFFKLSENLKELFESMIKHGKIDLDKNEVSKAILIRLKYYYDYQDEIKKFLNKKRAPSAADFFVETIVFYLKVIFKIYELPLQVYSEKPIRRGSIQPDISIWNEKGEVVAIIECKTQLGWERYIWKKDFIKREKTLKKYFPGASAFLIVLTSSNWSGFRKDVDVGKKFFCLSNVWPTNINLNKLEDCLLNPIEPLISYFIKKYKI